MKPDFIPERITIYAELYEYELGEYTSYIFKNLETNEYLNITKYPKWDCKEINIGDVGYLTYNEVYAGISQYYVPTKDFEDIDKFFKYNSTHFGFVSFIKKKDQLNNKNKIFKIT